VGDILAANVKSLRASFSPPLTHNDVAERMRLLGHDWQASKVSDLEHGRRTTSVEEVAALAVVLHSTIPALLDPTRTRGVEPGVDVGGELPIRLPSDDASSVVVPGDRAQRWVYGRRTFSLKESGDGWAIEYGDASDAPTIPAYVDEFRQVWDEARASLDRRRVARARRTGEEE
jgi:hypothetical protein